MNLMWTECEAVLHNIDSAIPISAAAFLDKYVQSVEGICRASIEIQCTAYTGYPN